MKTMPINNAEKRVSGAEIMKMEMMISRVVGEQSLRGGNEGFTDIAE